MSEQRSQLGYPVENDTFWPKESDYDFWWGEDLFKLSQLSQCVEDIRDGIRVERNTLLMKALFIGWCPSEREIYLLN